MNNMLERLAALLIDASKWLDQSRGSFNPRANYLQISRNYTATLADIGELIYSNRNEIVIMDRVVLEAAMAELKRLQEMEATRNQMIDAYIDRLDDRSLEN